MLNLIARIVSPAIGWLAPLPVFPDHDTFGWFTLDSPMDAGEDHVTVIPADSLPVIERQGDDAPEPEDGGLLFVAQVRREHAPVTDYQFGGQMCPACIQAHPCKPWGSWVK